MSDTPRISRPIPERTAPLRDLRGVWAATTPAPPSAGDVAERTVDSAYRVLDEHLRRGRDSARRWSPPDPRETPASERRTAVDDMASLFADAAHALFDVLAGATRGAWRRADPPPDERVAPRAAEPAPPVRRDEPAEAPPVDLPVSIPAPAITIVVRAAAPVEVALDLHELPAHGLLVGDLCPLAGSHPPLTRASVERRPAGLRLHLDVPAGQPAGTYAGPVHDAVSGAPTGTLRVTIDG
jgi:hypothetical protein